MDCTDVSAEDVGNYTCEVHGPHNALLASVTHRVIVAGFFLFLDVQLNCELN